MSLISASAVSPICRRIASSVCRPVAARTMSDTGHIRDDAGSTFAKKEKAIEEQYFRKEQQKAIDNLKTHIHDEIEQHKQEIKRHKESIKRHEDKLKRLHKEKDKH